MPGRFEKARAMLSIGFVMDPLEKLNPKKDSTILMMRATTRMGHAAWWCIADSVHAKDGHVYGRWNRWESDEARTFDFDELDFVFLREEPPVDIDFIHLTYLYELAKRPVFINTPRSLRDASEKMSPLWFPECMPRHVVSRSAEDILAFVDEVGAAVCKPLGWFGSKGVFKLVKGQTDAAERVREGTGDGKDVLMVQEFLPGVARGDRRIFLFHGEVHGSFDSIPAVDDFRGNSGFGATWGPSEPSPRELEICAAIAPRLVEAGVYFAGVDFVDELITEINVTCPAGFWNMNDLYGGRYEDRALQALLDPFLSRRLQPATG